MTKTALAADDPDQPTPTTVQTFTVPTTGTTAAGARGLPPTIHTVTVGAGPMPAAITACIEPWERDATRGQPTEPATTPEEPA